MGLRRRAPFLIQFVGKICHKCSSQNLTLFLGALVAGIEEMAFALHSSATSPWRHF